MLSLPQEPSIVLVVDDDRIMRQLLCQAMQQEGYQVVEASNGEECLSAYVRFQPHIVLLDAMMPVMDGFTCCSRLQDIPSCDRTPVLMITGLDDKESVDRAFEVGAIDFVTKPIHWPVLRQRVRRLIQQFQLYQQLEVANRDLQRLATFDSLTGLANRRRFDEYLGQEWRRMLREQLPLSLIFCDIDFFKTYNDTYGHQAGDICLQTVAGALFRVVKRSTDLVARYGGEEFAVILPNTSAAGGLQVATEIRQAVKSLEIVHTKSAVSQYVTLSLGVAGAIPLHDASPEALLKEADEALYRAKAGGRDRVCS
ncbi:PleD family two-component system response regulator [Trichocoleus sp. ST-U3]|uniref:response regulator n=1 Tax=Coleofasciculus sp. FACHB-542 TaxID=2692787 RepID=UPI001685F763|nr:PleD family two-component system response regulator [Coleofasciculus sp. FACHB-542]MBD2086872.1 PleD family two-component system response regulator [Coleofasciculus sp. FACHB-542]